MQVRYKALGAAQTVTGSRHLLEIDETRILLDCGLFQGRKEFRLRNWDDFPYNVSKIHAIVLSHAHIDHSGYLPKIVKEGFTGPIHCTSATASLLKIMLLDSAKLQEEEAEWANKKGYSKHKKALPLYTVKEAEEVFPMLVTHDFDQKFSIEKGIDIRFLYAGHILGAAMVEISLEGLRQKKKILFTGDLGREDDPLLKKPQEVKDCDILLMESTYGGRESEQIDVELTLEKIIHERIDKGVLLIPAFSVGRTQNILYYLRKLMNEGRIDHVPVYIDSPMAISVTELYRSFSSIQKIRDKDLSGKNSLFNFNAFRYVRNRTQSAILNELKKKAIVISASGMCTGGRILHHLFHRLKNENDTVIMVGYQAEGTRGRDLIDGKKKIRIFGQDIDVKCKVEEVKGMSAHADRGEMLNWLGKLESGPKMIFTVHGEKDACLQFQNEIKKIYGYPCFLPNYQETFELFNGI